MIPARRQRDSLKGPGKLSHTKNGLFNAGSSISRNLGAIGFGEATNKLTSYTQFPELVSLSCNFLNQTGKKLTGGPCETFAHVEPARRADMLKADRPICLEAETRREEIIVLGYVLEEEFE